MKELSIEGKATLYDQAIKLAKSKIKNDKNHVLYEDDVIEIFPEIVESEDEQHRKWILEYLYDGLRKSDEQFKDQFKCAIAWLEKQGEQKSAEWHREDEQNLNACLGYIQDEYLRRWITDIIYVKYEKPAEWSEEDEEIHRKCICAMRASACGFPEEEKFVEQVDNWLKSLRPQSHWRPSEEQMDALRYVTNFDYGGHKATLVSLYEQLKKLKG